MSRLVLCLLWLFICCGCGDSGDAASGQSAADRYVAGLEKSTQNGHFRVQLIRSTPEPAYVGLYTWTLKVLDRSGASVNAAVIEAEPIMIAHGHGTMPQFTTAVEAGTGMGEYRLQDLDLFMPGTWTVFLTIETLDGVIDTVEFAFDLEG